LKPVRLTQVLFQQNQVFLGGPADGLAHQSHQELTVGCGEGFLGRAKTTLGTLVAAAIVSPPQLDLRSASFSLIRRRIDSGRVRLWRRVSNSVNRTYGLVGK
jgi:hypothetical protein